MKQSDRNYRKGTGTSFTGIMVTLIILLVTMIFVVLFHIRMRSCDTQMAADSLADGVAVYMSTYGGEYEDACSRMAEIQDLIESETGISITSADLDQDSLESNEAKVTVRSDGTIDAGILDSLTESFTLTKSAVTEYTVDYGTGASSALGDYSQFDPAWADYNVGGYKFSSIGCGICACADVLWVTPTEIADYCAANGFIEAAGLAHEAPASIMAHYGYETITGNGMSDDLLDYIRNGYYAIVLFHPGSTQFWTKVGHYVTVSGYRNGQYYFCDPAANVRSGWYGEEAFSRDEVYQWWVVKKLWKSRTNVKDSASKQDSSSGKNSTKSESKAKG